MTRSPEQPRHEVPVVDAAGLEAARATDRAIATTRTLAAAGAAGSERWLVYLEPLPDAFRDAPIPALRAAARRTRAAFGPKDSIRDVLPSEVTEPLLDAVDRLLRAIARHEAARS